METAPPANVLTLARRRPTARRWAAILEQAGFRVWLAPEEVPGDVRLDLLVTDRGPDEPESPPEPAQVGVVRIGAAGPADACLPEDFTERELRLACRLVAQIARLRRREQSGTELTERLAREALTDPLTGLPNRRAWDQALAERLALVREWGLAPSGPESRDEDAAGRGLSPFSQTVRRLCVAILDLDLFKPVNDAHGHPAGDEVLRAVGRALREGLRQDDFVARLGGDEFGLLLWVSDASAAARVVDRARQAIPAALARVPTHVVTASAGYRVAGAGAAEQASPLPSSGEGPGTTAVANQQASPLPSSGEGPGVRAVAAQEPPPTLPCPNELFAAADEALRTAKQQGRDRTVGE